MAEEGKTQHWHAVEINEALRLLESSENGLGEDEAGRRLEWTGMNALSAEEGTGPLRMLAEQFHNPLIYLLGGAAALSVIVGHPVDAAVIAGVIVLNAVLGFVQEWRADGAMISTGTMAMIVAAIPVAVCLTARRENETPRNGPKKAPSVIGPIALASRRAMPTLLQNPMIVTTTRNHATPAIMRICVAAKASRPCMPYLLSTRPTDWPTAPPKAARTPRMGREKTTRLRSGLRSSTTRLIPPMTSAMPSRFAWLRVSPIIIQPINAVIGGTRAMISIDTRAPIRMKLLKRSRSPIVNPITPERASQIQL